MQCDWSRISVVPLSEEVLSSSDVKSFSRFPIHRDNSEERRCPSALLQLALPVTFREENDGQIEKISSPN